MSFTSIIITQRYSFIATLSGTWYWKRSMFYFYHVHIKNYWYLPHWPYQVVYPCSAPRHLASHYPPRRLLRKHFGEKTQEKEPRSCSGKPWSTFICSRCNWACPSRIVLTSTNAPAIDVDHPKQANPSYDDDDDIILIIAYNSPHLNHVILISVKFAWLSFQCEIYEREKSHLHLKLLSDLQNPIFYRRNITCAEYHTRKKIKGISLLLPIVAINE